MPATLAPQALGPLVGRPGLPWPATRCPNLDLSRLTRPPASHSTANSASESLIGAAGSRRFSCASALHSCSAVPPHGLRLGASAPKPKCWVPEGRPLVSGSCGCRPALRAAGCAQPRLSAGLAGLSRRSLSFWSRGGPFHTRGSFPGPGRLRRVAHSRRWLVACARGHRRGPSAITLRMRAWGQIRIVAPDRGSATSPHNKTAHRTFESRVPCPHYSTRPFNDPLMPINNVPIKAPKYRTFRRPYLGRFLMKSGV